MPDQINLGEAVGFWFSPLIEEAKGISFTHFKGELEGVELNYTLWQHVRRSSVYNWRYTQAQIQTDPCRW